MPSIIAVSVFGLTGIQSAAMPSGMSARVGLITTRRMPAACARSSQPGRLCKPAPPEVTWLFFTGMPPNATMMRVCPSTLSQSVTSPLTGLVVPITCGSRNCAAPQL
ncbi:hypothetical protein D3C85_1098320 [compost metagenome]